MGVTRKLTKTAKRTTRMPRKLAHGVVVVSTKVLDSALNGVHKSLKRITKGTRKLTKTALLLNKKGKTYRKKGRKSRGKKASCRR